MTVLLLRVMTAGNVEIDRADDLEELCDRLELACFEKELSDALTEASINDETLPSDIVSWSAIYEVSIGYKSHLSPVRLSHVELVHEYCRGTTQYELIKTVDALIKLRNTYTGLNTYAVRARLARALENMFEGELEL